MDTNGLDGHNFFEWAQPKWLNGLKKIMPMPTKPSPFNTDTSVFGHFGCPFGGLQVGPTWLTISPSRILSITTRTCAAHTFTLRHTWVPHTCTPEQALSVISKGVLIRPVPEHRYLILLLREITEEQCPVRRETWRVLQKLAMVVSASRNTKITFPSGSAFQLSRYHHFFSSTVATVCVFTVDTSVWINFNCLDNLIFKVSAYFWNIVSFQNNCDIIVFCKNIQLKWTWMLLNILFHFKCVFAALDAMWEVVWKEIF